MTARMHRRESYEWVTYTYRQYSDEARDTFGEWIIMHDWMEVVTAEGSNAMAEAYQKTIDEAMDRFFPLRTVKKKSTDLPWITKAVKKKIRRRKRIYIKEGFSDAWKRLKKEIDKTLKEKRKEYMDRKKQELTSKDANRNFFRLVKAFNTPEKPQTFDVRDLRPGVADGEVAEELATFFNRISSSLIRLRSLRSRGHTTGASPLCGHMRCLTGSNTSVSQNLWWLETSSRLS